MGFYPLKRFYEMPKKNEEFKELLTILLSN